MLGGAHVELVPADSHHYVRLALLQLSALRPVAADPFVAFPFGAENYWPPLHTLLVAFFAGPAADPELGAAFVGPAIGALGLAAVALVGRATIGAAGTLVALAVLALTPVAIESAALGSADHHVHEPIAAALTLLLVGAALGGSRRAAIAAGIVAAGARLFTTAGFILPAVAAAMYVAGALAAPRERRPAIVRQALRSGGASAALLAVAVVALGRPLPLDYEALSLFHPLLSAAAFAGATIVCAVLAGERRTALLAAPFLLAAVPVVVQLRRATLHLRGVDPLIAVVSEATPLAADIPLAILLFGPPLLLLPFALAGAAAAALRRAPGDPPLVAAALGGTVVFLAGAAFQSRFAPLLSGAMAVILPLGLGAIHARLPARGRRWMAAAAGVAAIPLVAVLLPRPASAEPDAAEQLRPTLRWMRDNLPPASADPYDPDAAPSYGVLAPFEYGHFINLYAERPALASTFSQTPGHVRANQAATAILAATDVDEAARLAREARLRYVIQAPTVALLGVARPDRDALYFRLGRDEPVRHFRRIHESAERRPDGRPFAIVYELVEEGGR